MSDRKGVNVPDVVLAISPLTAKDRADLDVALDMGVDWIALSFVQRPEDIAEARNLIGHAPPSSPRWKNRRRSKICCHS